MKNIKITLLILFGLLGITGCDKDFQELNTDPNNPVAVPAHLLLGGTQRLYANVLYGVLGGTGGDMGAIWAQLWTKVQYNDEERYVPRQGVIDNIWTTLYTSVVSEADAMYNLAVEEDNPSLQGAALVMKGLGLQTLTELYGPIPYTEALSPGTTLKPVYDNEATVFQGVIDMYTQAASLLAQGNGSIEATSDLFYGGDTGKWVKFANSLKFRALMRISSTRDVSGELQALINSGRLISSNSESAQLAYLPAQPDANPIYETIVFGARAEYKVNSAVVDMMSSLNDPRLAVYAAPNASGVILGKPAGYGNQTPLPNDDLGYTYANISALGDFYLNSELPGTIISYSELSFLKAEAANKGLISGGIAGANEYYLQGIEASFDFNGVDGSAYLAQPGLVFATQSDGNTKIGNQKWIALFDQGFEAWTEWRRTKIPVLSPAVEGAINSIPTRYRYPQPEQSLNGDNYSAASSSIGGDALDSPLFWQ